MINITCRSLKIVLITVIITFCGHMGQAQEMETKDTDRPHPGDRVREHHKHSLSVLLSHVHIGNGSEDGNFRGIQRPSWMLVYNYSLSERWALGLHGDIILETFSVEHNASESEEDLLEREYPISLVGAGSFKVIDHLAILLGGGLEFDKSEAFGLIRFGVEPFLRLTNRIELILNLSYDVKFDAYDSWNLGFGIAYGL